MLYTLNLVQSINYISMKLKGKKKNPVKQRSLSPPKNLTILNWIGR